MAKERVLVFMVGIYDGYKALAAILQLVHHLRNHSLKKQCLICLLHTDVISAENHHNQCNDQHNCRYKNGV